MGWRVHTSKNIDICREAEKRLEEPVDDSAVVDDMFGFLEEQKVNINELWMYVCIYLYSIIRQCQD